MKGGLFSGRLPHNSAKPEDCWCNDCVARNYPTIAALHPNSYMAGIDAQYRRCSFPELTREQVDVHPWPSRESLPLFEKRMREAQLKWGIPISETPQ